MDLDRPQFSAAQIAELAHVEIVTVHTWTTRGLANPYGDRDIKRGRGQARLYSLRDALRFYLMARFHQQFRLPLPAGIRICQSVFSDSFSTAKAAFLFLDTARPGLVAPTWCKDIHAVEQRLAVKLVGTVLDVKEIVANVTKHAEILKNPKT